MFSGAYRLFIFSKSAKNPFSLAPEFLFFFS